MSYQAHFFIYTAIAGRSFVVACPEQQANVGMVESFDTETFTTINKFKDLLEELVEYEGILDEYDCEYEYFEENEITIIDTDVIDDVKKAFNIMVEESMDF